MDADSPMNLLSEPPALTGRLKLRAFQRILAFLCLLGLLLFIPAGRLDWWQAWVYIALLLGPMAFIVTYLLRHDPALMERRMRFREKEKEQRRVLGWTVPLFLLAFLVAGFDRRFGWSALPVEIVLLADILVFAGYLLVARVFVENSHASRVVEVERDQRLVDTGLYALIRHPMYAGILVMYLASPLALGSWPAALIMLPLPVPIIFRIRNEEQLLSRELQGYREYLQRVRYRLIPGIW